MPYSGVTVPSLASQSNTIQPDKKFDLRGTPLTRQALLSQLHPQHRKQRRVVFHAPRSGPGGRTAAHVYYIELHLAEVQLAAPQEALSQMVKELQQPVSFGLVQQLDWIL